MSEKVRKLKEDAARLIARGKLAEAAQSYEKIVKADNKDLTARQKLGELYARLGRVKDAVREYQSVAGSYAADGLLLKAIAVCKIILQVDPSHSETQSILADLSTKRRGDATAVEMPRAMSAALGSGKRSASEIRGAPAHHVRPKTASQVDPTTGRPVTQAPPAAGPPPVAPVAAPPKRPTLEIVAEVDDDLSIDVSFDSSEGAPVIDVNTVAAVSTPLAEIVAVSSAPVVLGQSVSQEGPPVVVGSSASQEGAAIDLASALAAAQIGGQFGGQLGADLPSHDALAAALDAAVVSDAVGAVTELPADELIIEDSSEDGGADVIDLEPAQVDIDKIPAIPLFSDLPKGAFIVLTERMELRVAGQGDVLMQEGERGASMFIIIQGKVAVSRTLPDGRSVQLAELSDGTFFGEMALLSDAPRTATVTCNEDVMLFEISRELLNEITSQYPSVGEVMKRFHKNRLLTNLLKTSPIFAPFSTTDKKDLIEKFKSRSVTEGTYLITRERPGEGLYVILSGRCEVLDQNAEGKSVFLAELKEGDVFGEMSMLWHKQTCASVRAVTSCTVLRLPRESFNEVIMTHPQILETLTALSEARQRQNTDLKAQPSVDFLV